MDDKRFVVVSPEHRRRRRMEGKWFVLQMATRAMNEPFYRLRKYKGSSKVVGSYDRFVIKTTLKGLLTVDYELGITLADIRDRVKMAQEYGRRLCELEEKVNA